MECSFVIHIVWIVSSSAIASPQTNINTKNDTKPFRLSGQINEYVCLCGPDTQHDNTEIEK